MSTMRIDLTCPVEAWKSTLPTKDNPACEVTLFNLSSLQVVSVEVTLLLSSADGEETAKIIHRSRGMNGAPGKTFLMTVPVEGHISPEKYEVTVEKVWFDNASVWRREKENTISYTPNNLHRSAQLTTLRSIAGEMASGYPEQQKGLWVCVCGRPNLDDAALCARCHQEKAEVFARYSREAVDAEIARCLAGYVKSAHVTLPVRVDRHAAVAMLGANGDLQIFFVQINAVIGIQRHRAAVHVRKSLDRRAEQRTRAGKIGVRLLGQDGKTVLKTLGVAGEIEIYTPSAAGLVGNQ